MFDFWNAKSPNQYIKIKTDLIHKCIKDFVAHRYFSPSIWSQTRASVALLGLPLFLALPKGLACAQTGASTCPVRILIPSVRLHCPFFTKDGHVHLITPPYIVAIRTLILVSLYTSQIRNIPECNAPTQIPILNLNCWRESLDVDGFMKMG